MEVGEPLAELYSPELYQATRELLLAQRTSSRALEWSNRDLASHSWAIAATWLPWPATSSPCGESLRDQIDQILAKGKADYRLPILAPICGFVVRKNIVEGQYVTEGEAMFEVADLCHVWVQAQIYEDQVDRIRAGPEVEATVHSFPGQVFRGRLRSSTPLSIPTTRTVNVRYDLPNADLKLRPGMYATVTLKTPVADTPCLSDPNCSRPVILRSAARRTPSMTAEEQKICPVTKAKLGSMGEPIPVELEQ